MGYLRGVELSLRIWEQASRFLSTSVDPTQPDETLAVSGSSHNLADSAPNVCVVVGAKVSMRRTCWSEKRQHCILIALVQTLCMRTMLLGLA